MEFFIPAYIDPGVGQQIFQSMAPFWAMLIAILGALLWPLKQFFFLIKKPFKNKGFRTVFFTVLVIAVILGIFFAYQHFKPEKAETFETNRVIVIGMDGMDYSLAKKFMDEGKLPNFKRLAEQGTFAPLKTVYPPQSPVAWSTFATGLNPGGHRLFDFLWRHEEDYMPALSISEFKTKPLKIGGIRTPIETREYANRRAGKPFWKITSEKDIPTTVIHAPVTFPAEQVSGKMLSGMGVPDLKGTQGTFSFYSTKKEKSKKAQGGLRIPISVKEGKVETYFSGPYGKKRRPVSVPLMMIPNKQANAITFEWQDESITIEEGHWSEWLRVRFPVHAGHEVYGMTRLYVKSVGPEIGVYASAFNFTPEKPMYEISHPNGYAKKLKDTIGDFHTLGMPHDTWALNEGVMTEEMFLEQSNTILEEEIKMLEFELPRFKEGLFTFVIVTPDRLQHMFWRAIDEKNPLYDEEFSKKYGHVIEDAYKKMDEVLGKVMMAVNDETTLMVISDHGFGPYRRSVHINSWLRDNGYLSFSDYGYGYGMKKGTNIEDDGKSFFEGVDWSQSKAYAVGLGSIYLNLKGREGKGIVDPKDADIVKKEIAEKLKQLKDDDGTPVVKDVFFAEDVLMVSFLKRPLIFWWVFIKAIGLRGKQL